MYQTFIKIRGAVSDCNSKIGIAFRQVLTIEQLETMNDFIEEMETCNRYTN